MSTITTMSPAAHKQMVQRRGELMAELFLQGLQPAYLAQSTGDFWYDFLVVFTNPAGGINNFAVEVVATEQPVKESYRMSAELMRRCASSNLPVLFLLAEVKKNHLYYAWPHEHKTQLRRGTSFVTFPVTEINSESSAKLRKDFMLHGFEQAQAA